MPYVPSLLKIAEDTFKIRHALSIKTLTCLHYSIVWLAPSSDRCVRGVGRDNVGSEVTVRFSAQHSNTVLLIKNASY